MYYVCHNTHILVKGKMKKDEKNEEKKRMNPWFYAIFWLSRQKLASKKRLTGVERLPDTPNFPRRNLSRRRRNTRDAQVYNLAALVGRCVVKGFLHVVEDTAFDFLRHV